MKLRCVIVEDEPLAVERAKEFVRRLPWLELITSFSDGKEAFEFLKQNEIDLLFLDLNLGETSGIALLEKNEVRCHVIITTAYQEYALKGFELNVADYLLKPFVFERFEKAVNKVRLLRDPSFLPGTADFILVRSEYKLEKIYLRDILYIEGMGDYRRIHTNSKRIMTLQTFRELEEEIPSSIVCRIHKSYMVAIKNIESVGSEEVVVAKTHLPVSSTYRKNLMEVLKGSRN